MFSYISGYLGNIMAKQSIGFTKIKHSLLASILFLIYAYYMSMSLKKIPLGITYYITYSSSLIILTTVTGIFFYKEKYNHHTIVGTILVLVGISNIYLNKKS